MFKAPAVLMLLKDFGLLCQAICLTSAIRMRGAGTIMLKDTGDHKLRAFAGRKPQKRCELTIQLHGLPEGVSISDRAKGLLKPLENPLILALELSEARTVNSPALPPGILTALGASAGPNRIWFTAWAYDTIDKLRGMMVAANGFANHGDYASASRHYSSILDPWYSSFFRRYPPALETSDAVGKSADPLIGSCKSGVQRIAN